MEIRNVHQIAPREAAYSFVFGRDVLPSRPGGVAAEVEVEDLVLFVSRLDGESEWTIDGASRSNGLPIFQNGEGARYTARRVVTDAEAVAALDAAAG